VLKTDLSAIMPHTHTQAHQHAGQRHKGRVGIGRSLSTFTSLRILSNFSVSDTCTRNAAAPGSTGKGAAAPVGEPGQRWCCSSGAGSRRR
jgi:hypothetical protein